MSHESNLTRLWLKWVESSWVSRQNQGFESSQSRVTLIMIWVRVESTWILFESNLSHWFCRRENANISTLLQHTPPALIQHVPRRHLGKNIIVLKNSRQPEKSIFTHAALESTLTTATEIFQIRAHLNAQNTHFLATYFFRMTLKKHKIGSHLETRPAGRTTQQGKMAPGKPRRLIVSRAPSIG